MGDKKTAAKHKELDRQLAMRRENREVYRRIFKDFEREMNRYNNENEVGGRTWGYRVKDSISALLRVMYHVNYAVYLPAEAETEMRAFVKGVLELMEQYSPKL